MKRIPPTNHILIVSLALLSAGAAFAATEEKIEKKFSIQPGGTLVVDVEFGSITVATNGGNEVVVEAWRKITRRNKAEEDKFLADHPVKLTQEGNTLTVRSRVKSSNISWSWNSGTKNEANYTITVPARFNARLDTSGGSISVTDLAGEVDAHTSGGGLAFVRLHGPLNGETSGGRIVSKDCEGKQKVHTSGGGIEVTGGSGSLDGQTSGGSVGVKRFKGPVNVDTSGGAITIENVAGSINGSTSGGSIHAALSSFSNDIKLETSGGGITVRVPATAAFNLDAETSAGRVTSDLPVVTNVSAKRHQDKLKGPVNGGGNSLHLRTSAGSIRIVRVEKIAELESSSK